MTLSLSANFIRSWFIPVEVQLPYLTEQRLSLGRDKYGSGPLIFENVCERPGNEFSLLRIFLSADKHRFSTEIQGMRKIWY